TVFFIQSASAMDCPDDGFPVKADLSVVGKRVEFCQVTREGIYIKHGPEKVYNLEGKLIENNFYEMGKKRIVEEKKKISDVKSINKDGSSKATTAIKILLKAMMPFFKNKETAGNFWLNGCRNYHKKWISVFLRKKDKKFKYLFKKKCDIQGVIVAKSSKPIHMKLDLRNIDPFKSVDMKVSYKIVPGMLTDVEFEILSGVLHSSSKKMTTFTGDYAVTINPLRKGAVEKNHGGKLVFSQVLGSAVNLTKSLWIK
ncbi:MAG: hypothetical protein HOJ35_05990, partial [Bdellovibrionales bacterium]|nr:hypothetical protein [Bdellovibrionales bacterium]